MYLLLETEYGETTEGQKDYYCLVLKNNLMINNKGNKTDIYSKWSLGLSKSSKKFRFTKKVVTFMDGVKR